MLERDDVGSVGVVAYAPNAFTRSKTVNASCFNKNLVSGLSVGRRHERHELRGHRFSVVHPPAHPLTGGGRNAQHALVFGQSELIQNRSVDSARAGVERRIGSADVEGVEVGHLVNTVVVPKPPGVKRRLGQHQQVG